jgi:hypothetical protein
MARSSSLGYTTAFPNSGLRFPTATNWRCRRYGSRHTYQLMDAIKRGWLRRTASQRSFALPVASLHDRFGSYGRSLRSVPQQLYPSIAAAIAATLKTPALVESRMGAVAWALSHTPFPTPALEPDVRSYCIRLSDWLHCWPTADTSWQTFETSGRAAKTTPAVQYACTGCRNAPDGGTIVKPKMPC